MQGVDSSYQREALKTVSLSGWSEQLQLNKQRCRVCLPALADNEQPCHAHFDLLEGRTPTKPHLYRITPTPQFEPKSCPLLHSAPNQLSVQLGWSLAALEGGPVWRGL